MRSLNAKGVYFAGWVTIALSFFFLIWVFVSLVWPFDVLDVDYQSSFVVPSKNFQPGDDLVVSFTGCKNIDVVKTVTVNLIGETIISVPSYTSNLPIGCYNTTTPIVKLPTTLASGWYRARITYEYHINVIRTVTYHFETNQFFVTK